MSPDLSQSLESARTELVGEYAGVFAPETVESCLDDSYQKLLPATIHGFLPLLAQRFARERLCAAARSIPGAVASEVNKRPLVLFVCTAHSGRSQMAAALLNQRSAG